MCLSVCLSVSMITPELLDTVRTFSGHQLMVKRSGKFENGCRGARVVISRCCSSYYVAEAEW